MKQKTVFPKITALIIGICVLLSVILPGCGAQPIASGAVIRILDYTEGASFGYPPIALPVLGTRQASPALEPLFRVDEKGVALPWLATGYKNDAEAKTTTITLRKEVKFHDGTDFNAEAVKWNLDQYVAAKTGGTQNIKSIDVVDDYTIRINLVKWDKTVMGNMTYVLGIIISPTAFKTNGQKWCETHPVGTGPFKFVSYQSQVSTIYEKFDNYWQKGKPRVAGVQMKTIIDATTRELSFRGGEGDVVLQMQPTQIRSFKKDGYPVTSAITRSGMPSIVFDSANSASPWANVKVRQAASHAINVQGIESAVYFGMAEISNQWTTKSHWAYNPAVAGYPYDPDKAKKLLAEAGYPNGFKTKILHVSPDEEQALIFAIVQNDLAKIGIQATLDTVTGQRWGQIALQGGTWEGLMWHGGVSNPDFISSLSLRYGENKTANSQVLRPDDYLKALQNAAIVTDFSGEQKAIQEAMKLMIDKYCLLIPLPNIRNFAVVQKNVENHGWLSTPSASWWTPEDVWIKK